MLQENAEIEPTEVIRRWFDAWNRADLDTFTGFFDDDAVTITDPNWVEPGQFEGRAAIRRWYEGIREAWGERNAVVINELFEAGGRVVARVEWQVRGRSSKIETVLDATCISEIDQGRIVRQQWYLTYGEALEAAGLSE